MSISDKTTQGSNVMSKLVRYFAELEGLSYQEALYELKEMAEDYESPEEFLDDLGFEGDYIFDAMNIMGW